MRSTATVSTRATSALTTCAATLVMTTALATDVAAQRAPSDRLGRGVQVGDRARIRVAERDATGRRIDCEGRVTAVVGDTIVLENGSRWGTCARRLYEPDALSRAEISSKDRGSRALHAALGLGGGVLLGGGVARVLVGDGCDSGNCGSDGNTAAAIATFGGAVLGGVAGGLIGLALPAGPEWRSLATAPPVRVAGFALRPSVQLSVR